MVNHLENSLIDSEMKKCWNYGWQVRYQFDISIIEVKSSLPVRFYARTS